MHFAWPSPAGKALVAAKCQTGRLVARHWTVTGAPRNIADWRRYIASARYRSAEAPRSSSDLPARSRVRLCSPLLQTVRSTRYRTVPSITKHRTLGSRMAKILYARIRGSPPAGISRTNSIDSHRSTGRSVDPQHPVEGLALLPEKYEQ